MRRLSVSYPVVRKRNQNNKVSLGEILERSSVASKFDRCILTLIGCAEGESGLPRREPQNCLVKLIPRLKLRIGIRQNKLKIRNAQTARNTKSSLKEVRCNEIKFALVVSVQLPLRAYAVVVDNVRHRHHHQDGNLQCGLTLVVLKLTRFKKWRVIKIFCPFMRLTTSLKWHASSLTTLSETRSRQFKLRWQSHPCEQSNPFVSVQCGSGQDTASLQGA